MSDLWVTRAELEIVTEEAGIACSAYGLANRERRIGRNLRWLLLAIVPAALVALGLLWFDRHEGAAAAASAHQEIAELKAALDFDQGGGVGTEAPASSPAAADPAPVPVEQPISTPTETSEEVAPPAATGPPALVVAPRAPRPVPVPTPAPEKAHLLCVLGACIG